jgi:hypothetical protein
MRSISILSGALAITLKAHLAAAVILDTEGLPDSGLNTSSWAAGVKPPLADIFNLHDMQLAVKNYLGETQYGEYPCHLFKF